MCVCHNNRKLQLRTRPRGHLPISGFSRKRRRKWKDDESYLTSHIIQTQSGKWSHNSDSEWKMVRVRKGECVNAISLYTVVASGSGAGSEGKDEHGS